MGQYEHEHGTRDKAKAYRKLQQHGHFFIPPVFALFVFRFYFVFALPTPYPAPTLPPRRAETYKQRRKFAIKAKVHIELECFAFYVA